MDKKMIIKLLAGALFLSPVFSNATTPYVRGYDKKIRNVRGMNELNVFALKNREATKKSSKLIGSGNIESVPMFLGIMKQKQDDTEIDVVDIGNPERVACVHLSDKVGEVDENKYLKMGDEIYTFNETGTSEGSFEGRNVYALSPVLNPKNKDEKTLEHYVAWFEGSKWSSKGYYRCQQKEGGKFDWKDTSGGIFKQLPPIKHSDVVFYKSMPEKSELVFFPEAALASVKVLDITVVDNADVPYCLVYNKNSSLGCYFNGKIQVPGSMTGIDGTIDRLFVKSKSKAEDYAPFKINVGTNPTIINTSVFCKKGDTEFHIFKTIHVFLGDENVEKAEKCFGPKFRDSFLKFLVDNLKEKTPISLTDDIFDTFLMSLSFEEEEKEEKKKEKPFSGGTSGSSGGTSGSSGGTSGSSSGTSGSSETESTTTTSRTHKRGPKKLKSTKNPKQPRYMRNPAVSQSASSNSSRWQSTANTDDEE